VRDREEEEGGSAPRHRHSGLACTGHGLQLDMAVQLDMVVQLDMAVWLDIWLCSLTYGCAA